jgi:hypothetical protein
LRRLSGRPTSRKRPFGVTVLAILQVFAGFQSLAASLLYFALSSWAKSPEGLADLASSGAWVLRNASGVFFLLASVYLILGIGSLLLARGYVKGFERARRKGRLVAILAIVFAFLGIFLLPNRVDPGSPFWTIVLNAIVIAYLGSRKVRTYFS